jgi:hypothetical protein
MERGILVERRLGWVLAAGGALGLLWAVLAILPRAIHFGAITAGLAEGPLVQGPYKLIDQLPLGLQWLIGPSIGPGTGVALLALAFVCGVVMVAGRGAAKLVAGLGVLWFAYVIATLSVGGYWAVWSSLSGDPRAYLLLTVVSLAVVVLVSAFALLTARELRGRSRRSV